MDGKLYVEAQLLCTWLRVGSDEYSCGTLTHSYVSLRNSPMLVKHFSTWNLNVADVDIKRSYIQEHSLVPGSLWRPPYRWNSQEFSHCMHVSAVVNREAPSGALFVVAFK